MSNLKNKFRLFVPGPNRRWLANLEGFSSAPENILCIPPCGLGDMVMDARGIDALKHRFPRARITLLIHARPVGNELFKLMSCVDKTIDIGLKNYKWLTVIWFMLFRFWRLALELRRDRFDLVVVFVPNIVRKLMLAIVAKRHWLYGNRIDVHPEALADEMLRSMSLKSLPDSKIFDVPACVRADNILPKNLPRPLIAVHPFCGMSWRGWNKFDELLEYLPRLGGTIIVVGRKAGYKPARNVHDLVNKLSVAELFWVISCCDVFITADSGPMHISFALKKPTVALFGPVGPELRVSPYTKSPKAILYFPPSGRQKPKRITQRTKTDNSNMQKISVEQVLVATKKLLVDVL